MRTKNLTEVFDPIRAVVEYATVNGSITNRECRRLLGVSYDHSVRLLNELCTAGVLFRRGATAGTHYVLANPRLPSKTLAALKAKIL
jgi:predicted HTH transcriptional regulator